MFLLVDGYNVLHHGGFLPSGVGPGTLRRARGMLLGLLSRQLPVSARKRVTVVFDAGQGASSAEPRQVIHEMQVYFAVAQESADDLIEELIRAHSAPRQLTVVSSDRRLQRAARRRGADFMESADWLEELRARLPVDPVPPASPAPDQPLSASEVQQWLEAMGMSEESEAAGDSAAEDSANPFPPGYADDVRPEP